MEWISVNDRLPEIDEFVLIAMITNSYFVSIGERSSSGEYRVLDALGTVRDVIYVPYWKITHWMPLPEPPKE